ncbi:MAG TPA: bifunctional diguanylate cyclase/phosphodiesterase [Solirubrobacteraceae bacterium]|nr:bifunctional diguanylate cyclase/phosphodiesterase [Solirubrobacteraceae bacterium]
MLVLGFVLARSFTADAARRGLAEGVSEAKLVARSAIEPVLTGRQLTTGIEAGERRALRAVANRVVARGTVLRLRVRDLEGRVRFSSDGSGLLDRADDEALDAGRGKIVAHLTHLNADSNDTGDTGTAAVEVYLPLEAGSPTHRVGVLEIYLPYAPIGHDVSTGLERLYLDLALGLAALYVVLFAITASVSASLRKAAALNAYLAEHDPLSGLANRTLFQRRLDLALRSARDDRSVVVAVADLDRFKHINDTLGHDSGDRLLRQIAHRLAAALGPGDVAARLGGDEFGLLIETADGPEPALRALRELMQQEVEINGLRLAGAVSLGYAIAPADGVTVAELMQRAELAMYAAKASHAGCARYSASLRRGDASSFALLSELPRAIARDELVLHYQPQAAPEQRQISALEALVRWQHPDRGLLYPDSFIPMAEQTDVIDALTEWVLRAALIDLQSLGERADGLAVAVNVSARSIGRTSFASEVIGLLDELNMPGRRLIIEVTETALLTDPQRAAGVLAMLAGAGVGISLDDFGRGQTSLSYLSALPLGELKIDRSFVTDMVENGAHASIVRSLIDLGHNLGLRVVAEGVETEEVMSLLHAAGCDLAQGYLLARPLALADLGDLLRSVNRSVAPTSDRTRT